MSPRKTIYNCICMHSYLCTNTYIDVNIVVRTYIVHYLVCICVHVYVFLCMSICACIFVCVYVSARVCVCARLCVFLWCIWLQLYMQVPVNQSILLYICMAGYTGIWGFRSWKNNIALKIPHNFQFIVMASPIPATCPLFHKKSLDHSILVWVFHIPGTLV